MSLAGLTRQLCQLLPLLLVSCRVCGQQPDRIQRFLREPPDQTAKVGEQVTLPCRVEGAVGKLQWTRDDFGLGLGRDLTGFDRYEMTGSDAEGDYTLSIFPVQLEDDAVFQCQVGAAEGVEPIRSRYATLTVTVPPEPPQIINGKELHTEEDRLLTLECVSRGGKPPAEITWLDSANSPITEGVETVIDTLQDGKRQTSISLLRRRILKQDHKTNISCEAQNSAEASPSRTSIHLLVEYSPYVSLHYQPHTMYEGDSIHFKCTAEANPPEMTFRWFVDGLEVKTDQSRKFGIQKIKRSMQNSIVKCEARNKIGKSEETHTLNIHYEPVWIVEPRDSAGEGGEEATLQCAADGNPPPVYAWYRHPDFHTVISYGSNLTVFITETTQGTYTCRATVKGFPAIETSARLLLKGPPKVVVGDEVVEVELGGRAELHCQATGVPLPNPMEWSFNGVRLLHGIGGYKIDHKNTIGGGGLESMVRVDSVSSAQLGEYNCSIHNKFGGAFATVLLTLPQGSGLVLPVAVGSCVGLLVTVFLFLLVIQCRRARDKPHPPADPGESWESDKLENDNSFPAVAKDEEELLHQRHLLSSSDNYHTSPRKPPLLADNFSNPNLNVRDPHFSAMYGNPYLRTSVAEQAHLLPDELGHSSYPDSQYAVYGMYSVTPGGNGSVPAHYIVRHDQLNNSLATHV